MYLLARKVMTANNAEAWIHARAPRDYACRFHLSNGFALFRNIPIVLCLEQRPL